MTRADPPSSRGTGAPLAAATGGLTIERLVAVDSPREVRVHPRDRTIAFTRESAGARQIFVMPLRGGTPVAITASEKHVGDPQWSPDGRRLAYVRGDEIRIVDVDGGRDVLAATHPSGVALPRWSPDGRRLAFTWRRRGWSQLQLVDAPIPRRGRPARDPRPPEPRALTATGFDVEDLTWSARGDSIAVQSFRAPDFATSELHVVDVASGDEQLLAGGPREWAAGPRPMPGGGWLYLSDESGWFQVVRVSADGRTRTLLTAGDREHGEPSGGYGYAPLPSPDGERFVHVAIQDALIDLVLAPIDGGATKRGRGRPPKGPSAAGGASAGQTLNPWPGVWRSVDFTADGSTLVAIAESQDRAQDVWVLPVRPAAPAAARPRQVTYSMPAVLTAAFAPERTVEGERIEFTARDGLRIEGTLWRPTAASGRRGGRKVPTIVYPHGGPTWQAYRAWVPFKQLLVREGFAFLDVDFRGSTGYGRAFRIANHGEWGNADTHDMVDGGRWAAAQPWSNGRLGIYGGSYGGYLVLTSLVDEPSLWAAGVDLYGDSEIAESYRHGDRPGRLDLGRMMGSPDDPAKTEAYRRGSPLYRAERIEAPLLILHGRKDRRVVPLMSEKMIEALEIEGKHHEVHWYDEEAHGWEKPENKRDAFNRIRAFLRRHLMDDLDAEPGDGDAIPKG
ncbi:MAG TPA: prolyl oligopeptidase family serine peptidase, partial [Candidatus Limnocylindrales bacterium]|nr:prolyl oligopeptidase family serine peptidase [Candidatus Limnocylindrales bacterium]